MKRNLASLEQRIEALEQEAHKENVPKGLEEFNAACERLQQGSKEAVPGLARFYGEDQKGDNSQENP